MEPNPYEDKFSKVEQHVNAMKSQVAKASQVLGYLEDALSSDH